MDETAGDDLSAEDDAAVFPMVDAIAGFEHRAVTGHDGVEAYLFVFCFLWLAAFTTGCEK